MPLTGTTTVVAGAGIGGLAAALLLARAGASVTLLDRVTDPGRAVGAGILLQPNGLAVLGGLGLGEALSRAGRRAGVSTVRRPDGTPIVSVATPDFGPGLDHVLALRRSDLVAALLDAVAAQPRITTRFGAAVVAAYPDGAVDTAEGRVPANRIPANLVVGADGVNSTVRAGGDFGAHAQATGARYLRGLVPRVPLEGEFWTPLGLFGGAPVDATTTYFYAAATAPAVADALARGDPDALRAAWTGVLPAAGPVLAAVAGTDELLVDEVVRVDCARWVDRRLVLLGDAAHAMAPTLGQGANSALVDAAVLAIELSDGGADPLARYTARRRRPVRRVQDHADRLAVLSGVRSPVLRGGRDAALGVLGRLSGGAGRWVQQEDPAALRTAVTHLGHTPRRGGRGLARADPPPVA
jgi:2-polyprenyl-6-methoxyphenol hydroxylase-like FAD-dependent oxidoreductase